MADYNEYPIAMSNNSPQNRAKNGRSANSSPEIPDEDFVGPRPN